MRSLVVMQGEIQSQVSEWNADDGIGAMVLTGAGRAFSAGADVGGFEDFVSGERRDAPARPADISWVDLARESKPIVCALNGVAVGLGITLPLSCDVRLAAEDARISFRFLSESGSDARIRQYAFPRQPCRVWGRALEYMLTGRFITAQEAKDAGFVNRVCSCRNACWTTRWRWAQEIADNPALAPSEGEAAYPRELHWRRTSSLVLRRESETLRESRFTPEHQEALTAFRERREPKFHWAGGGLRMAEGKRRLL